MPKNGSVYLVDGNAYIHRAYHAISPLSNAAGLPTHAIFGFSKIINRIIDEKSPRRLAIAFDARGPNFRHDIYPDYKANRPPMADDLAAQIPYIKELVQAYNILSVEQAGVEADDLLASMARTLQNQGLRVVIVSGDKDMLQLVSEHISIWDPMGDKTFDEAAVEKKYGVPAAELLDLFALIGDKSDNVPGVPGVGPKTAAKLISEFHGLDELYANIDNLKKSKVKENLIANQEQARLSRRLIRLKDNLPTPALADYEMREPDQDHLTTLFTTLDFTSMLPGGRADNSCPLDPKQFHLLNSTDGLSALCEKIKKADFLTIDTETTSLDTLSAELVGISLSIDEEAAYYIPIAHRDDQGRLEPGQLPLTTVQEYLSPFLSDPKFPKLGHNLKFDYAILARHELTMQGPLWDTMLASYIVDPTRRSHKLDTLSAELLEIKMISFQDIIKRNGVDNFSRVPIEQAVDYAAEDAACTLRLWHYFEPLLDSRNLWPLFSQVEIRLIPVLADMEANGILIDRPLLESLAAEFSLHLQELTAEIHQLAGRDFNINSPQQLAEILFDKLGLPHGRKTKNGYSTDIKVLEKLAATHPLPRLIIEYRNLAKLKSSYVDKLPGMIHPKTGRLHTSFNQAVTATGRLSSSDPNLQNIPIRSAAGQRIRAAFIPAPGCRFLSADYSQIDLRVLAHYAQDPALIQAFCNGEDIHSKTAAEIFRVNPEVVNREMRRVAKSINFGIVYGMSAFGLAGQLHISRKEAATFIARYFELYKGVQQFMTDIVQQAETQGFVTTLLGRRRPLPDINSKNKNRREAAQRTAMNTPIQGTAADIIKLAAINVAQRLKEYDLKTKLLLQIHDELILEVPEREMNQIEEIVKVEMETVLDLRVPLVVNTVWSHNLAKE
ncbi:MAG TPA: DNA polymerase I [Desulfobacterales bacterium]|nr:DNA polymerase I [Desulfobacterales bacterium]